MTLLFTMVMLALMLAVLFILMRPRSLQGFSKACARKTDTFSKDTFSLLNIVFSEDGGR